MDENTEQTFISNYWRAPGGAARNRTNTHTNRTVIEKIYDESQNNHDWVTLIV